MNIIQPPLFDFEDFIKSPGNDRLVVVLEALDAEKLIAILERFQQDHADPIILVFDSKNEYLDIPNRSTAKLHIVAARNADSYIKKHIDQIPPRQRRNLRVVSSDRSLYFYAKDARATPMKCEEFWGKI